MSDPQGAIQEPGRGEPPRAGPILVLWVVLTIALHAAAWITGARATALSEAIETGAAQVESRGVGEVGDDVVRKAIALQHDTRSFWAVLVGFGDFVVDPISLPLRAGLVAVLFAGIALLRGRRVEFAPGMAACAWAQGFWVLGLALRTGLAIGLRRPEVETSPTLLLPPGTYPAAWWVALRQLDVFAILGWFAMARAGVARMRVGWVPAALVVSVLFLVEASSRIAFSLVIEAGMRLSLLPES